MNEHKSILDVSRSPSKKQIRTSKISVFIVSTGQLKIKRHWQGYQRAGAKKASSTIIDEINEHESILDVSNFIKQADQDLENIRFYSLGWPTEKQSTLAGLPTRRCIKSVSHNNT